MSSWLNSLSLKTTTPMLAVQWCCTVVALLP
jgi:hypothetical protein